MEVEAIRVIMNGPKWVPATQYGYKVNAYRRQPVTFLVENDDVDLTTRSPFTFYTGVDNDLTVKVHKVKTSDLDVRVSKGTITKLEDGRFNVKVSQPGRVIVTIYNTKTQKMIEETYFWAREEYSTK